MPSRSESVHNELRGLILSGKLPSGYRLVELKLCDQFGVSRTPIREAIRRLESEDLVQAIPGWGAFVKEFDDQELNEMLCIRESLEGLSARLAARRRDSHAIEKMQQAWEAMSLAVESGDREQFKRHDLIFHAALLQGSGNRKLVEMMESFAVSDPFLRDINPAHLKKSNMVRAHQQHRAILDAVRSGDSVSAERRIRHHVFFSGNGNSTRTDGGDNAIVYRGTT